MTINTLPYLCACGERFTSNGFYQHRQTCSVEWVELPVDPFDPQMMTSEQRHYYGAGYERALEVVKAELEAAHALLRWVAAAIEHDAASDWLDIQGSIADALAVKEGK